MRRIVSDRKRPFASATMSRPSRTGSFGSRPSELSTPTSRKFSGSPGSPSWRGRWARHESAEDRRARPGHPRRSLLPRNTRSRGAARRAECSLGPCAPPSGAPLRSRGLRRVGRGCGYEWFTVWHRCPRYLHSCGPKVHDIANVTWERSVIVEDETARSVDVGRSPYPTRTIGLLDPNRSSERCASTPIPIEK